MRGISLCVWIGVRPLWAFALAVGLCLPMTAVAQAQVLLACVNTKNGGMRLVASPADCNTSKEAAVSWNVVGPEGPQGDPGAEGPQGPPGPLLRVFDAEGNVLGIPNGRGGWFFNEEMGLSVLWATARGENIAHRQLWFTEENCEGQAFLELNSNRTFVNALICPTQRRFRPTTWPLVMPHRSSSKSHQN